MRSILLIFALAISTPIFSQTKLEQAIEHIKSLKDGILLVRLEDKARKIAYYRKQGNEVLADKIADKTAEKNEIIRDAFKSHYEFSKYGYFYMNDSKAVLNLSDFSKIFGGSDDYTKTDFNQSRVYICTIDQGIIDKERALNHPGYQIYYLDFFEGKQVFKRLVKPFPNGAKFKLPFKNLDTFFTKEIQKMNMQLYKFYNLNK